MSYKSVARCVFWCLFFVFPGMQAAAHGGVVAQVQQRHAGEENAFLVPYGQGDKLPQGALGHLVTNQGAWNDIRALQKICGANDNSGDLGKYEHGCPVGQKLEKDCYQECLRMYEGENDKGWHPSFTAQFCRFWACKEPNEPSAWRGLVDLLSSVFCRKRNAKPE